jgi:hypothetical protein
VPLAGKDAWLVALDLLDETSERQLAKVRHVLLKLSDRLLSLSEVGL